jgi:hypothetical protein
MPQWAAHYNPFNAFVVRAKKKKRGKRSEKVSRQYSLPKHTLLAFLRVLARADSAGFFFRHCKKKSRKEKHVVLRTATLG